MESVPRRPTRRAAAAAAAAAAEELVGEEVGQSSGGTAQKKSQANQASVALALEVGGCFPLSVPGGLPALLFFFVRTFVRIVRPCMRESRCVCSYVWLFVLGGVFFFLTFFNYSVHAKLDAQLVFAREARTRCFSWFVFPHDSSEHRTCSVPASQACESLWPYDCGYAWH